MNITEIKNLLASTESANLSPEYEALYHDYNNDWHAAHRLVQDLTNKRAYRIHAYLHRKEGDLGNAQYWYHRAGLEAETGSLDEEWTKLCLEFQTLMHQS